MESVVGPRRGRGVRVRGGTSSRPGPRTIEDVESPRRGRGVRVRGGRSGRPGPRTIEELTIRHVDDMPVGEGLQSPLHPRRKRRRRPSTPTSRPSLPPPPTPTSRPSLPPPPPQMEVKVEDVAMSLPLSPPSLSPGLAVPSPALLVIQVVTELPGGHALETPLHIELRSTWQPSDRAAGAAAGAAVAEPVASTSQSAVSDWAAAAVAEPVASTSQAAMVECVSPLPPQVPPSSTYMVPSPAAFIKCGQVRSPSTSSGMRHLPPRKRPRQNRRDAEISALNNLGSDADSDESAGEDEDHVAMPMVPRVLRPMYSARWGHDLDEEDADDGGAGDAAPAADSVPAADLTPSGGPVLSATDQPWNLFDFEWREFPTTPIPPESRRETFSQINVGPTIPDVDPYDIFVAIWDRQFMEYIASETNRYAQQVAAQMLESHNLYPRSRIANWCDTNVDELFVYIGITLAMGVVVKSRVEEYWTASSDIFSTPGFRAHMPVNRFILLNKCLHFVNNDDMCALDLDGSEARIFKINPIVSHLNSKFQTLYTLSQNIALDESLLMWKGWLNISQLIPNKAANRGIKTYELCESQTGYLWRFEIHAQSKSEPRPQPENPLDRVTPALVLKLTQGLEYKGYTLWMDNYYNSPSLARRLKSLGIDCVGTLRTDRQFLPEALHNLTKCRMNTDQITGLTSGDVDVMVWKDVNRVATISTYHGNGVQTLRGSTKPILIHDYNIMMGGVDKKDQLLAMYPVERKRTKVWYKKLFRRLLNVSILNSFIIHRANSSSSSMTPLTHRKFRITLINSLLSKHASVTPILPRSTPQNTKPDVTHRLNFYPLSKSQRIRRLCVVCRKKVQMFCVGCDKTVCVDPCFLTLHS